MTSNRFDFACTADENNVYAVGGKYGLEDKFTGKIEKFNGNHWRILEVRLPVKLRGCVSTMYNNTLLVFGGRVGGYPEKDNEDVFEIPIETPGVLET